MHSKMVVFTQQDAVIRVKSDRRVCRLAEEMMRRMPCPIATGALMVVD